MTAREDAEAIFRAAVARVDPAAMVERSLSLIRGPGGERLILRADGQESAYDVLPGGRIFATGMGKASARMALGLERVLGGALAGGLVAVKEGHLERLSSIRLLEAGHPIPDARSEAAAAAILRLGASLGTSLTDRDIVIVLVSGGGSSILCAPAEGLSIEYKAATTKLLLSCGATIDEINCVRKHLSAIKGGRLAQALSPATIITLALSDVVGDDLASIASGPTVPDPTSFADTMAIIRRYGIEASLPPGIVDFLQRGTEGEQRDTPKPGDALFAKAHACLVGTNRIALEAAREEAQLRGYNSLVLSSRITGEAREIALVYLGIGKDISKSSFPLARPACLIAGGEATVTIKGSGKGGRNQEMVLAFLTALGRSPKDGESLLFMSAGTDGNDGPTDAAGAYGDLALHERAREAGLSPAAALADNDSYTFFAAAGGLVKTGPTNTNVCDVQILIVP
jgi:glycerate 2-kinase